VQFGKHKIYTALVKSIGKNPPAHYQAKYIIDVIDDYPIPAKRSGELKVFVAISSAVAENLNTIKVRVMNGFNPKTIRMMSASFANNCLEIKRKVTKPEFEQIKQAIEETY
jgi:hypothetical protein